MGEELIDYIYDEIEKADDRARKVELLEYVRIVDTIINDVNSEEIAKIVYQNYEEED